jgi:hypothetical protein
LKAGLGCVNDVVNSEESEVEQSEVGKVGRGKTSTIMKARPLPRRHGNETLEASRRSCE